MKNTIEIKSKDGPINTPLKKKVFVGMSGGVDSSVSAALLKQAGFEVIGVFIKAWEPPLLPNQPNVCTWREDRRDAMRAAAALGISFMTLDLEKEYKTKVVDYMIAEYRLGRTPNPDVVCNQDIKFGVFYDRALSLGADYVATGHYAQSVLAQDTNQYILKRGVDRQKDQSYFLWNLTGEQLSRILFPIGGYQKDEVRRLAKKFNLPNAEKKDSQGLCFLGRLDMVDFLKNYIPVQAGLVLDESGKVIGEHQGVVFCTLGQRHGFTVNQKKSSGGAYYVIAKDIVKNTLTVSQKREVSKTKDQAVRLLKTNWINQEPLADKTYDAQLYYHGEIIPCRLVRLENTYAVEFDQAPKIISPGQSVVIYEHEICLGGGVVA